MSEVKPREFALERRASTLESDYDAYEVFPESECDPKDIEVEKIMGHIRTVDKAAYDKAVSALKEAKKMNDHIFDAKAKRVNWGASFDMDWGLINTSLIAVDKAIKELGVSDE